MTKLVGPKMVVTQNAVDFSCLRLMCNSSRGNSRSLAGSRTCRRHIDTGSREGSNRIGGFASEMGIRVSPPQRRSARSPVGDAEFDSGSRLPFAAQIPQVSTKRQNGRLDCDLRTLPTDPI